MNPKLWEPIPQDLQFIIQILNLSSIADNQKQREVYKNINELSKKPEFFNYLIYILSIKGDPSINALRQMAGLTLKSILSRSYMDIPEDILNYMKPKLLETFSDDAIMIRRTVGLVMTALVEKGGFHSWPELLRFLIMNLNGVDDNIIENSIDCISKIIEDVRINAENFSYLESDKIGQPLNELIPKLITFCADGCSENIREKALYTLNLFMYSMPPILIANISIYFNILYQCCLDKCSLIRQRACQGFCTLLEIRKDLMMAHLLEVMERMVICTSDKDHQVAKHACLFWHEFLIRESEEGLERINMIQRFLPKQKNLLLKSLYQLKPKKFERLLPILIECLRLTEEDLMNINDLDSEISTRGSHFSNDSDDDEEIFTTIEEEKKDFFDNGEWTLRRISGNVLDKLATYFRDEIFLSVQTKIVECLSNSNWKIKESGILCLGVLATGCLDSIEPNLNDLIPFLIQNLENEHYLIRTICCWTLSRFTTWMVQNSPTNPNLIKGYLTEILKRIADTEGKVQEAACTAFSRLVNEATYALEPFLLDILHVDVQYRGIQLITCNKVFSLVLEQYKGKSILNLYDSIACLAEYLKEKIQDLKIQEILISLLLKKWGSTTPEDHSFISLLECFNVVAISLGSYVENFAQAIIEKCLLIIFDYLKAIKIGDKKHEYHKRELMVRAIDFLSTILANITTKFELYVKDTNILIMAAEAIEDKDFQVRQFIFSLIGEFAKYCPNLLNGKLSAFLPLILKNLYILPQDLDPDNCYLAVCNNAAWALGEIAMAYPSEIKIYLLEIANKLVDLLQTPKMNKTLAQNLSISLGRFGLVDPQNISQILPKFLKPFCLALEGTRGDLEKLQAFRGLLLMISFNIYGITKDFPYLCNALVDFQYPDNDLKELATKLIQDFKILAGESWQESFQKFPKQLQIKMHEKFNV